MRRFRLVMLVMLAALVFFRSPLYRNAQVAVGIGVGPAIAIPPITVPGLRVGYYSYTPTPAPLCYYGLTGSTAASLSASDLVPLGPWRIRLSRRLWLSRRIRLRRSRLCRRRAWLCRRRAARGYSGGARGYSGVDAATAAEAAVASMVAAAEAVVSTVVERRPRRWRWTPVRFGLMPKTKAACFGSGFLRVLRLFACP